MTIELEYEPTLEDLLRTFIATETGGQLGGMPGRVVKYTPATQRADVKPLIQMDTDGSGTLRVLPICRDVPVQWPSGAGWALTGPMAVGDTVWLQPAGGDIHQWLQNGTPDAATAAPRKNSLSDVVAVPGLRPATSPLTSAAYDAAAMVLWATLIKLGSSAATKAVGLHQDPVSIDTLVSVWMGQVETFINTLAGSPPGPPVITPLSSTFTQIGALQATATKVKAE